METVRVVLEANQRQTIYNLRGDGGCSVSVELDVFRLSNMNVTEEGNSISR